MNVDGNVVVLDEDEQGILGTGQEMSGNGSGAIGGNGSATGNVSGVTNGPESSKRAFGVPDEEFWGMLSDDFGTDGLRALLGAIEQEENRGGVSAGASNETAAQQEDIDNDVVEVEATAAKLENHDNKAASSAPSAPVDVDEVELVGEIEIGKASNVVVMDVDELEEVTFTGGDESGQKADITAVGAVQGERDAVLDVDAMVDAADAESVPASNTLAGVKRSRENDLGLEIVEVSRARKANEASEAASEEETACASCANVVKKGEGRSLLSRCKHILCPYCGLKAAVDGGWQWKPLPMCPVERCFAPLSRMEVEEVLVPEEVDDIVWPQFSAFLAFLDICDSNSPARSPDISFNDPSRNVLKKWTTSRIDEENFDEAMNQVWLRDDFTSSFAPLWSIVQERGLRKMTCKACRESMNITADKNSSIPIVPHCILSRALGLTKTIQNLKVALHGGDDGKSGAEKTSGHLRGKLRAVSRRAFKRSGFAQGTGFGGTCKSGWKGESVSLRKKTAKKDSLVAYWLGHVRCFIIKSGLSRKSGGSSSKGDESGAPDSTWPCYMRGLLRKSGLVGILGSILMNDSIMDVGERVAVYISALRVVSALTDVPSLRTLAAEKGPDGRSLAEMVDSLSKQAALLTAGVGDGVLPRSSLLLVQQVRRNIRGVNRNKLLELSQQGHATLKASGEEDVKKESEDEEEKNRREYEQNYVREMKTVQFEAVRGLHERSVFLAEASRLYATLSAVSSNMKRIASEVASLSSTLPLYASSGILVRVDEERYDFLRACIFGPEDTPYAHGAFVFDIFLPPGYPDTPPKFQLLTTGGGRVRFNPNLYACGKVCLSLLGTWSGPGWTKSSTLLQVLVSIQSLILVNQPYFNEPGLENSMGTKFGDAASKAYNAKVRKNNVQYAMLANILHPPPEFAKAVHLHFRLKRDVIKKDVLSWQSDESFKPASVTGPCGQESINGKGKYFSKSPPMLATQTPMLATQTPGDMGLSFGSEAMTSFFQAAISGATATEPLYPRHTQPLFDALDAL